MKHDVEEVVLKNKAKGLLIDIPGANVMSSNFCFRAGNYYAKSKDIEQVAHIMEHMAFGANSKYKNEQDFEADFIKNGAYHNAYTSNISMCYVADCADFEWDRILNLQRLAISEPRFNEEELVSEKGNVKNELTGYLNNHHRLLWVKIQQLLGEDAMSYRQKLGTIQDVSLADVKEHYKRTHTAENMRFIIAGKLSGRKGNIVRQLESWSLGSGERLDVPITDLKSGGPALIRRKEVSNLNFGWSMMLPRVLSEEEAYAMGILNHILTGTLHSRIFGTARKKGLVYGINSSLCAGTYDYSWDFSGQVNYETAEALFDIIVRELSKVLKGNINDSEIEAAKTYAIGQYQMSAQTVAQIANFYSGRYFMDGFVENYDEVPNFFLGTSKERIVATAKEFFDANIWALAGVSGHDKEELQVLNDKLLKLFN